MNTYLVKYKEHVGALRPKDDEQAGGSGGGGIVREVDRAVIVSASDPMKAVEDVVESGLFMRDLLDIHQV